MKLVKGAKRAWTWFSMQAMFAAGAIQVTWQNLSPDMKASIPDTAVSWLTTSVLVLGAIGRLVQQGGDDA